MREDFENPDWKETATNPHDTPLSATGRRQALDVALALHGADIAHIFSSPFLRALETAHPLAAAAGRPILIEPGFSEWLNPAWFASPPRWLPMPYVTTLFSSVDPAYQPLVVPGFPEHSETDEVFKRVGKTLDLLFARYPEGNIAVFAHGSPLGQAIAGLIGTLEGIDLRTAAITQIALGEESPRLVSSDSGHLHDTDAAIRFH